MILRRPRIVAIATHPVQYHAPLFRALANRSEIDFEVAFAEIPDAVDQGRGFGIAFQWDVPVLEGYRWTVLRGSGPGLARGFFGRRLVDPRGQIERYGADVMLTTGWQAYPLLQAAWAARSLDIPLIVRGESNGLKQRPWYVRAIHRKILSAYDAFLVIGSANRRFYLANGIPQVRLVSAPYFVDNAYFSERARHFRAGRSEHRRQYGIAENGTCFVFVGKLEAKKRPGDLLDALAIALATDPGTKLHVLIVGSGPLEAMLRRKASARALPVTFSGFLNQSAIAKAYVSADALVLPSTVEETWGLVVNEAMNCGLPAIVSDQVGCGLDLIDAHRGAVFPFGDVHRLADVLLAFARDSTKRELMGDAARAYVVENHTVERSADAVIEAARLVLGMGVVSTASGREASGTGA